MLRAAAAYAHDNFLNVEVQATPVNIIFCLTFYFPLTFIYIVNFQHSRFVNFSETFKTSLHFGVTSENPNDCNARIFVGVTFHNP